MNAGGPNQPLCEEKKRLLLEYDAATQAYFRTMSDLRAKMGTSPKALYDLLFEATESARSRSELARTALLQHIRVHNC
jgi:hypothetical protein